MSEPSPCMSCGACCAFFRVSFYWRELDSAGGWVPEALTEPVNNHLSCMQGTQGKSPRCAALKGKVGEQVLCTLYDQRPSPCREFLPSSEAVGSISGGKEGPIVGNIDCDRARAHYGLPPLVPNFPYLPEVAGTLLEGGSHPLPGMISSDASSIIPLHAEAIVY